MSDRLAAIEVNLESDARWQLVKRVIASQAFAGSRPLRDFLLFVTEHTLRGHADWIKEQVIGADVLRRAADFDPASDNIVRVRARQLRQKLEHFFQSEGCSESIVITIPKGGYVPVFEPRLTAVAALPDPVSSAAPESLAIPESTGRY